MTATHVNPGDPLTAEAWNDLVDLVNGIPTAIEEAMPTELTLAVTITNPDLDPRAVRVVALKGSETSIEAVAPTVKGDPHLLGGLSPGAYTLRALAPGYVAAEEPVTVAEGSNPPVEMSLTPSAVRLPNLFGKTYKQARELIDELGLTIGSLRDFAGEDYVPTEPGGELKERPVLVQSPAAGTLVPEGSQVHLVIAVETEHKSIASVPPLIGMTLNEATAALAADGLSVGTVTVLGENPST